VEVLGFIQVPSVGVKVVSSDGYFPEKPSPQSSSPRAQGDSLTKKDEKKLNIILKADTQGTLEAVLGSLPSGIKVISAWVGNINESDILLAKSSGAVIVGFNVKASSAGEKLAESEGVEIKTHTIIYELLEDLKEKASSFLKPLVSEEILGQAKIIAEFTVKNQRIAGCRVEEGEINKKESLHVKREGKIVGNCWIISMKTGREDVQQVKKGEEFGAVLSEAFDFKVGDVLISYRLLPL